jgi:hypothetical protein
MDEGIHLPAPLQHHEEEHVHLSVVDKADRVLKYYQEKMPGEYTNCSSLFEAAKNLYKEVSNNANKGKLKVYDGTLKLEDFDRDLNGLLGRQQPKWDELKKKEAVMRERLQFYYQPVHEAELHVRDARGDGTANDAQRELARVYARRLKRDFHDAKAELDELTSWPNGLLSQIDLLHKRAETEARDVLDRLRKREGAHVKVPAVVLKMVGA